MATLPPTLVRVGPPESQTYVGPFDDLVDAYSWVDSNLTKPGQPYALVPLMRPRDWDRMIAMQTEES